MGVWPEVLPGGELSGREGALVLVSIHTGSRELESLLGALAEVDFPINPQIYHDAALVYVDAGGRRESQATTLVEFPAYEQRVDEVRSAIAAHGFESASVQVIGMLDAIHAEYPAEPACEPYVARYRVRRVAQAAAGTA